MKIMRHGDCRAEHMTWLGTGLPPPSWQLNAAWTDTTARYFPYSDPALSVASSSMLDCLATLQ